MNRSILICLTLFGISAFAQDRPGHFVVEHGKPWAYLRLDHVGPRKPLFDGEPEVGIWLRLVNNCELPIMLFTLGNDSKNSGSVVLDEVVPAQIFTIGTSVPTTEQEADRPVPPAGYYPKGADLLSVVTLSPGKELLFSVPRNHVSKMWNLRVQFFLKVGDSSIPAGPLCYVEFSERELLEELRGR
jgi:hypothetical protein